MTALTCDMRKGCPAPVAYIDRKGWLYCLGHAAQRRSGIACRKLTLAELTRVKATQRNYGIDDGNGNQLTTGLQEHDVRRVAQSLADDRGEDVYVYSLDGAEDTDGEWQPAESYAVSPSVAPRDVTLGFTATLSILIDHPDVTSEGAACDYVSETLRSLRGLKDWAYVDNHQPRPYGIAPDYAEGEAFGIPDPRPLDEGEKQREANEGTRGEWQYEVACGETMLGFPEWLAHKREGG